MKNRIAGIGHGTLKLGADIANKDKNPLLKAIQTNLISYIDTAPNYNKGLSVQDIE